MLKYQIDTLDGVDESLHGFYDKTDSGYQLKVDGVEDVTGLKTALQKERESNKDAKSRLSELEKQREEAEKKALEEQGKYKELSQKEREEKLRYEKDFNDLQKEIATSKRDLMLRDLASSLTTDPLEQEIIARFATDYVQLEGREVKYTKDVEDLKKDLAKFVRNKSSDANHRDNSNKGGNQSTKKRSEMTHSEKAAFISEFGQEAYLKLK